MVQIIGHLLGVFHDPDDTVLQIWDWSAGHRVAVRALISSISPRRLIHLPILPQVSTIGIKLLEEGNLLPAFVFRIS
jgi:hypothetical protein